LPIYSASIVMGGLSEHGAEEPSRKAVIFWGVATGAVAAIMLLAGGDQPSEALNGLKNITIVSSLPFVLVMLLLCVAIWKDLSKDPLMIRSRLARHVLEEAVDTGIDRHDGAPFELRTVEAVIDVAPADAGRNESAPIAALRARNQAQQATAPGAEAGPARAEDRGEGPAADRPEAERPDADGPDTDR